jgi:PAS domain S-box-containing protein
MTKTTPSKTELRQQAEAKLSKRKKSPAAEADTSRLIHELDVHQIELEMQNEELAQSRAELESTLSQYAELYAFAPVGYFTLTRDGTIRRANLTAVKLMGVGLNELIKRRFGVFISPESRITFSAFLDRVFTSGNKETCEVAIPKDGSAPLWVQIEAIVDSSGGQDELCYAIVNDITSRKAREQ